MTPTVPAPPSPAARPRRSPVAVVLVLVALLGLAAACSSDDATASASADGDIALIDVRTPEEFAEGHLEGAVSIPLASSDFDARIAELDPAGSYEVYCRTGNRSAQAVAAMVGAGFTDVTDLGGIDQAADATGRPVVTG